MGKELENSNVLNLLQINKNNNNKDKDPEEERDIPNNGLFNVFCDLKEERWK